MLWLLEAGIFGDKHPLLEPAVAAGHNVIHADAFTSLPFIRGPVMFHGSVDLARRMAANRYALCDGDLHSVTHTIARLGTLALNHDAVETTVRLLIHGPGSIAGMLGTTEAFVRPVSPFKQFSGRCIDLDAGLLPEDLDFGCYYDDFDLPVVVAPRRQVLREWHVVVKGKLPLTKSLYDPVTHLGAGPATSFDVDVFANRVARVLASPEPITVMDIAETPGGLRVIETNPFSMSDLYDCDLHEVVRAEPSVLVPKPC